MSDLISTREAAMILGVTTGRVLQLVRSGELRSHSTKEIRGGNSLQFERSAVDALRASRRGGRAGVVTLDANICDRAFRLFAAGYDFPACVRELSAPPHVVRKLYREWKTPLGHELATTPEENERAAEQQERAAATAFELELLERRRRADEDHRTRMERRHAR